MAFKVLKLFRRPRRGPSARGNVLVEFAMVAPLLFFISIVIFDMGLVVYDKVAVIAAAREGGRTAAVTDQSWQGVQACYGMAERAGLQLGSVTCNVTKTGDYYYAEAGYYRPMLVPGLPLLLGGEKWTAITVTGKALFRGETAVNP